jgi:hypothetical protein
MEIKISPLSSFPVKAIVTISFWAGWVIGELLVLKYLLG